MSANSNKKIISNGAEAIILLENDRILKERVEKKYRIKEIDQMLRRSRTKREAKILEKCLSSNINVPKIFSYDLNACVIVEEYLNGEKLRDILNENNYKKYAKEIAEIISKLHSLGIIHHDLTTSNMIYFNNKLYLIDFGLSFLSQKIEDMAVDLHLLERALNSKHPEFSEEMFDLILEEYNVKNKEQILKRLSSINLRGRYKTKNKNVKK